MYLVQKPVWDTFWLQVPPPVPLVSSQTEVRRPSPSYSVLSLFLVFITAWCRRGPFGDQFIILRIGYGRRPTAGIVCGDLPR